MNILITGGAGYIGYHLVKLLLNESRNSTVTVLDSFLYETESLEEFVNHKRLKIIKGDICNITDLVKVLKNIDTVVALAAIVGDPACALNEEQTLSSNYHSTSLLIQLCNYYKVKRIIFTSSCSVYGADNIILNEGSKLQPLSLYAKTRVMSEELIRKNASDDLDWVILRLATVFGWSKRMRFDLVVNFLTAKGFYDGEIEIINGDLWRPLIHVKDAARAIQTVIFAEKDKTSKEIFNVGGNNLNIQIKQIATRMKKYLPKIKIRYKNTQQDKRNYQVSFDKITHLLNFKPKYTLDFGIKEVISELKENKDKINYLNEKYYNVKYLFKKFNNK